LSLMYSYNNDLLYLNWGKKDGFFSRMISSDDLEQV